MPMAMITTRTTITRTTTIMTTTKMATPMVEIATIMMMTTTVATTTTTTTTTKTITTLKGLNVSFNIQPKCSRWIVPGGRRDQQESLSRIRVLSGHRLKRQKLREREKRNRETGEQENRVWVCTWLRGCVCVRACKVERAMDRESDGQREERKEGGGEVCTQWERERDGLPLKTEEV